MKIAINGLGRIGKTFLRALLSRTSTHSFIQPVVINIGPATINDLASIIKYDSIMSPLTNTNIEITGSTLKIGNWNIAIVQETEPEKINWGQFDIDWVIECSGFFTKRSEAERHLTAGSKHVLISAPAQNPDCTIIPGVNDKIYQPGKDKIVSLGSCTTNAIAPLIKVLLNTSGIEHAHIVTTHAYTNTQALLDSMPMGDSDPRRFRAAAVNIVPGSTGAGKLMGVIFPELKGKTTAHSLRVPVANVSLVSVTWTSKQPIDQNILLEAYINAKNNDLVNILESTNEPVVSSDFIGSPYSVTLDTSLIQITNTLGSVSGWYDNEYGYSNRMIDFLLTQKI